MIQIKAVIFDLDDTLIHSKIDYGGAKRALIKFLIEHGVEPSALSESMPNLEIFKVALRSLRSNNLPEESIKGILEGAKAILDRFEIESLEEVKLMEGALEVLDALKRKGLKIGIVTNGCREYAVKVIGILSLSKYIDALITRDDVSNPKPDPEHLLKALEALGISAEEAVFVGDHWIDSTCAEGAGVKFILFKSKKWSFKEVEIMKNAVINDLRSLPAIIQHI